MVKNMKQLIPLPFKHTKSPSWPWPTCADPKAFSFRAENTTMNSIFVSEDHSDYISLSSNESSRRLVSSSADEYLNSAADAIENVIRGVKSERLFFEPSETSSCIVGEPADKINKSITTIEDEHDDSHSTRFVVIEMETMDPFLEFKESIKEMVEAHGLKNLEGLEELLNCYLRVNGKWNHGYIIGAFVDFLVTHDDFDFIFSSSSSFTTDSRSTTCITQSPLSASSLSSFSTSNCKSTAASGVSSLEDEEAHA